MRPLSSSPHAARVQPSSNDGSDRRTPSSQTTQTLNASFAGRLSAPSSPVTSKKLGGANMQLMTPQPRRQSLNYAMPQTPNILARSPVSSGSDYNRRKFDAAASSPGKPEWMSKFLQVTQQRKKKMEEKPDWMKKMQMFRKQGYVADSNRPTGTPKWKQKERQKQEDLQRRLHVEIQNRLDDDGSSSSSSSSDESEEENVPEWMRKYKEMHLQKVQVMTSQGQVTGHITAMRHSVLNLTRERDDGEQLPKQRIFVSSEEPVPGVKHKHRKKREHAAPSRTYSGSAAG